MRWLRVLLRRFAAEGGAVLLSSHALSEVAQTVDDVVIISRGQLVTARPLADLDGMTDTRVRVRSPQAEQLELLLEAHNLLAEWDGSDQLLVSATTTEQLGQLANEHRIAIHEMTTETSSLEDVFLALTSRHRTEKVPS